MRNNPASKVHMINPLNPKLDTTPAIITTKAPVGPPIWNLLPPSRDIINPATTAVTRPVEGVIALHPHAMAKAMASGNATTPTVRPDVRSAKKVLRLYSRRDLKRLGACISPQTIRPHPREVKTNLVIYRMFSVVSSQRYFSFGTLPSQINFPYPDKESSFIYPTSPLESGVSRTRQLHH